MSVKFMIKEKRPDLVLLDIDNTLYDYEITHAKALLASWLLAHRLVGIPKEVFMSLYSSAKLEVKKRLGDKVAASHSRLLYFQHLIEQYGFKTQAQVILQLEQCYWHNFLCHMEIFSDVTECLAEIKKMNIPVVIVTDLTTEIQMRKIIKLNLDSYIDYVVTSEEAGEEKPGAKPFLLALEKVNLTTDATIWMIGDNPVADIQGAKNVISAVTIQKINDNQKIKKSPHADMYLQTFSELIKILEGY